MPKKIPGTTTISLVVPDELHRQLRILALDRHTSVQAFLLEVIAGTLGHAKRTVSTRRVKEPRQRP